MPEISEEELEKFKEAQKRAEELEASKKRLEAENSKIKSRAQEAEEKISEAEKQKLESEGKIQELLDKERAERISIEEKYKQRTSDVLREKLRSEVSKVAKDAHDVDMILRVNEHRDLLKLDESSLSVEGVNDFVGKVRESHSYLFSKKSLPNTDNTPPSANVDDVGDDESKYLEELKNCTTRFELNKVRKKYGKPID